MQTQRYFFPDFLIPPLTSGPFWEAFCLACSIAFWASFCFALKATIEKIKLNATCLKMKATNNHLSPLHPCPSLYDNHKTNIEYSSSPSSSYLYLLTFFLGCFKRFLFSSFTARHFAILIYQNLSKSIANWYNFWLQPESYVFVLISKCASFLWVTIRKYCPDVSTVNFFSAQRKVNG